jgi:hypothetical protein
VLRAGDVRTNAAKPEMKTSQSVTKASRNVLDAKIITQITRDSVIVFANLAIAIPLPLGLNQLRRYERG